MFDKILKLAKMYEKTAECCQLKSPGDPLQPGCYQMSGSAAQEKAKLYYEKLSEDASFLEKHWDASGYPALYVMELIAEGKPVSMTLRQQAVQSIPPGVDKCDFINVLNGWSKI